MSKFKTGFYTSSLKNIKKAHPDDLLGSVLTKVSSSHEPLFVFDNNDKFLGLVSPYLAVFRHRHPYNTKVIKCIFNPPEINEDTPVYKVAEYMVSTRCYFLPVFGRQKEITSIISSDSILKQFLLENEMLKLLLKKLTPQRIVTASLKAKIGDVYSDLRKKGISRIALVDSEGRLKAIISRRDIQEAFLSPVNKQRYSAISKGRIKTFHFEEESLSRFDLPISNFYVKTVISSQQSAGSETAIQIMIKNNVNSIILTDEDQHPLSIISVRLILKSLSQLKPREKVHIIATLSREISVRQEAKIKKYLDRLLLKYQRRGKVEKLIMRVNDLKNPQGEVVIYEGYLELVFGNGDSFYARLKDKNPHILVKEAIKKIDYQYQHKYG